MTESCSWCGRDVATGDGFRAYEAAGSRRATFCRLEHVVPWAIRGAMWEPGAPPDTEPVRACSRCGGSLGDTAVLLVRDRGEHRITDGFCGVEHLLEWAKAGGRYG